MENSRYLLIIPCSKRKKDVKNVPAIELYDGPFYRILRKHKLEGLDILIISARYGAIDKEEQISPYDQKMTADRAKELSDGVRKKIEKLLKNNEYEEIFVNLGKTYMKVLEKTDVEKMGNAKIIKGKIGERLHQMKEWLTALEGEMS